VDTDAVLESLPLLKRVRDDANVDATNGSPTATTPLSFAELVRSREVSHLQCTPSMARMVLQDPESAEALRGIPHLFIGGEAFPESLADDLLNGSSESVTNMYGPTETTIWSLTHRLSGPGPVPIGRPIANTRIHVLDRFGRPVPPGVAGHLWIAGDGVARGYHGQPELTSKRFVPDLYDPAGGRMYRTGDRVRVGLDGSVEFLGRVDHQVKVRGYRIELGEIEAALETAPGVEAAAAVLRTGEGSDARIEAFVVNGSGSLPEAELKARLRTVLPDYMIPSRIVRLEALPLTPNGKIDRNALPAAQEAREEGAGFVEPGSELEERVAACWRNTLGRERVGVEDNFFDIGGHSLLVVRLHRELQRVLDPAPTLVDLYRFPTIRALSEHLVEGPDDRHLQESRDRAGRRREMMARRRRRSS
jgi:acyl-coenzyme A synthetase/AMP-(fatty) acid ligase